MSKNQVVLTFAGDSKSLDSAFSKLQGQSDKTSSRFGTLAKGAKIAAGVFLGGLAVGVKAGYDEMKDGLKIGAQTEAVLKSTGQAAGVTQKDVEKLSTALANKSGVDDDLIQSGQNVLLTFTNIRNEVGKGKNIFDQATATALDMSVALGTDLKGANMQLGKALNDPVKGVTALTRVGVTFTQKQKDTIKALTDTGRTADAQKIILQELQKEFGGSAAAAGNTLPGQLAKAQNAFNNLAGDMVSTLLPAFLDLAGILQGVLGWMSQHETATKVIIGVLAGLAVGVLAVNTVVKVWTTSQLVLNAVLSANPIGLVILAIAALAAGVVIAYKNSETFRNVVKTAFDAIKTAAEFVKTAVLAIPDAIRTAKDNPVVSGIVTYYTTQFKLIKAAVELVSDAIGKIIDAVEAAKNSKVLGLLQQAFGNAFSAIKTVINSVADAVNNVISKVQSAISWIGSLLDKAKSITSLPGKIGGLIPGRANGGIITSPEVALIGEAGPEVVIPLTRPRRAAELMEKTGLTGSTGGGSGVTVQVAQMVVQDATDIDRVASSLSRQIALRMA